MGLGRAIGGKGKFAGKSRVELRGKKAGGVKLASNVKTGKLQAFGKGARNPMRRLGAKFQMQNAIANSGGKKALAKQPKRFKK